MTPKAKYPPHARGLAPLAASTAPNTTQTTAEVTRRSFFSAR
jgi:hypothetical protein